MVGKPGISKEVFKEVANTLKLDNISEDSFYFLENHDALVHMIKVASGIDSQVLGEQEIFGQFKALNCPNISCSPSTWESIPDATLIIWTNASWFSKK